MLNIESNELEIPDFNAVIEIKTKSSYFKNIFPITLFSATCDGEYLFELQRIREKYGVPIKEYNTKVLFVTLYGNKFSDIGKFKKGKLCVDYNEEKVYFLIINNYGKVIDCQAYWSFELLYNKLYRKLKYLAFVEVDRKILNKKLFFKYKSITIYCLKDFQTFLYLLDRGYICINIKLVQTNNNKTNLLEIYGNTLIKWTMNNLFFNTKHIIKMKLIFLMRILIKLK